MFIYSVSVSEESFYIWKMSNSCLEGITSLCLSLSLSLVFGRIISAWKTLQIPHTLGCSSLGQKKGNRKRERELKE